MKRRKVDVESHGANPLHSPSDGEVFESVYIGDTLTASAAAANSLLGTGQDALDNLVAQNEALRRSQSRLYRLGTALGLSRHTMRAVERRVRVDRALVVWAVLIIIGFFFLLKFILFEKNK